VLVKMADEKPVVTFIDPLNPFFLNTAMVLVSEDINPPKVNP